MTRSRLLGRGKLWRAGIGGDARRRSQACGPGALKPGEPQDRLWDATSPRIIRRRKPSRPGGTARTERARRWLRRAEAGETPLEWTPGVVDGGAVFENPVEGARLVRAGRLRNASPTAEDAGTRRVVWACSHCAHAGHDATTLIRRRTDRLAPGISGKGQPTRNPARRSDPLVTVRIPDCCQLETLGGTHDTSVSCSSRRRGCQVLTA